MHQVNPRPGQLWYYHHSPGLYLLIPLEWRPGKGWWCWVKNAKCPPRFKIVPADDFYAPRYQWYLLSDCPD